MTSLNTPTPYFDEPNQILCGIKVPHIFQEGAEESHKPIVDRYFTRYYFIPPNTTDQDHLVLIHSNRICMVGLAPQHVAFTKGGITSVDFNIGNCDRRENRVKGKSKKGAMPLQPTSALAMVHCADGSQYKVFSCVTGKLIEVNEMLVNSNPADLLPREGDGYVAIVLPRLEKADAIKDSLLTEEQYREKRSSVVPVE